jgi:hypothetical protein
MQRKALGYMSCWWMQFSDRLAPAAAPPQGGLAGTGAMASNTRNQWTFISAAFIIASGIAGMMLVVSGINNNGIVRALQLTARFSYLLFWCAYTGSSLATLFGPRFRPLARHGREFGLAFASAHSVHVVLVIWLYRISTKPPISNQLAVFFAIGLMWMYLLALFSIEDLANVIGARVWRGLRFVGLEYIQLAFLFDFVTYPVNAKILIFYLPFAVLGIAGTVLRLLVSYKRRMLAPKPSILRGT